MGKKFSQTNGDKKIKLRWDEGDGAGTGGGRVVFEGFAKASSEREGGPRRGSCMRSLPDGPACGGRGTYKSEAPADSWARDCWQGIWRWFASKTIQGRRPCWRRVAGVGVRRVPLLQARTGKSV